MKKIKDYIVRAHTHKQIIIPIISDTDEDVSVRIRLTGRGATAQIIGIIFSRGKGHISLHTLQLHEAPETTSNLLVKAVLADESTFLYDGAIRVEPMAQKTDAYQRNENLLLSSGAHAESKPTLEILANDVRCTHGATVGPIPEEQLWYLATRGIAKKNAEQLIVSGFLGHALEKVSDLSVRTSVADRIAALVAQP